MERIENRTSWRSCAYRGPLILHASAWPAGNVATYEKRPPKSMLECHETALEMCDMADASGCKGYDGRLTMREILEMRS